MEMMWKNEIRNGKTVSIEIEPIFSGSSKRPTEFNVDYWIDGVHTYRNFDN